MRMLKVFTAVVAMLATFAGCQPDKDSPERIEEARQEVLRLGGTIEENDVDGERKGAIRVRTLFSPP